MAATDQHYRSQYGLDVIFGVSCAALLLSTLWMFIDDYNRDFKKVQKTFRDVEASLAQREMIDKMPDAAEVSRRTKELAAYREELDEARARVAGVDAELKAERERTDDKYREIKAEYDSKMSYYNIEIDELAE